MPASMFSIDNILAARPRCKDSVLPVAPSAATPVVFPALHGDSLIPQQLEKKNHIIES